MAFGNGVERAASRVALRVSVDRVRPRVGHVGIFRIGAALRFEAAWLDDATRARIGDVAAKAAGIVSLGLWFGVACGGRWIGFS